MNKVAVGFGFLFVNDGTSTSIAINLSTQPVAVQISNADAPILINLNLAGATGVTELVCDSGATVTSSTLVLGILTVNLSAAGTSGNVNYITGILTF
jgi:hypothetical protein